jgi:hypothetical protein
MDIPYGPALFSVYSGNCAPKGSETYWLLRGKTNNSAYPELLQLGKYLHEH